MLNELNTVKQDLANHIRMDGERNADEHRARILRFNNELLRDIPHTKEEFLMSWLKSTSRNGTVRTTRTTKQQGRSCHR